MGEQDSFKYDAFISYRLRSPADRAVAVKLHRLLETYRTPRALVKQGLPRRLRRIFRDQEELSATGDLKGTIREALTHSRHLIVICSPRTPESKWVQQEVTNFRELGRGQQILPVLLEGEPATAFPAALKSGSDENAPGLEWPLAADVRAPALGQSLRLLKKEKLRLLAPMLGCRFDDLRQREHERRVRRLIATSAGLLMLAALLGVLGVALFFQTQRAQNNLAKAQKAIELALFANTEFLSTWQTNQFATTSSLLDRSQKIRAILADLVHQAPKDAAALKNLEEAEALVALLSQKLGNLAESEAALHRMHSVGPRVAIARLEHWLDSLDKPPARAEEAGFSWEDDPKIQDMKKIMTSMEARPEAHVSLSLCVDYAQYVGDYIPHLHPQAADERAEIQRVLGQALTQLRQAEHQAPVSSEEKRLMAVLTNALNRVAGPPDVPPPGAH